jgi:Tol biopolymer transport system component
MSQIVLNPHRSDPMRDSTARWVLSFSVLIAACGTDASGPGDDVAPPDTAQTRGALLASGEPMSRFSHLVWVPGSDLVAFTSRSSTGGGCAIKTLDTGSGATDVVDADCEDLYVHTRLYFRRLVATPDGSALHYTVGIGDPIDIEWVLRTASLRGGGVSTLRSDMAGGALAVSPDGRLLAYVAHRVSETDSDSLFVRDLSSGTETHYLHQGFGQPITFSPDGAELLYHDDAPWPVILRRLSLGDSTNERVALPDTVLPRMVHWGPSGIAVFTDFGYPVTYWVMDVATGASVQVGAMQGPEGGAYEITMHHAAWSTDGTQVAYWIGRCYEFESPFGDCVLARYALFVADTHSGTRSRVAYTSAEPWSSVFSPDGTRLVYHTSDGEFYVVAVP